MRWPIQASTIFGGIPARRAAEAWEEFAILAFHGENLQSARHPAQGEFSVAATLVSCPAIGGACFATLCRLCQVAKSDHPSRSPIYRIRLGRRYTLNRRSAELARSVGLRCYFFGCSVVEAAAGFAAVAGFGGGFRPSILIEPTFPVFGSTVRIAWLFVSAT